VQPDVRPAIALAAPVATRDPAAPQQQATASSPVAAPTAAVSVPQAAIGSPASPVPASPAVAARSQTAAPIAAPGFDLARAAPEPSPARPAEPVPATPLPIVPAQAAPALAQQPAPQQPAPQQPAPQQPARPSLADAFGDLGKPEVLAAPASGAVDIRRIKPAQPKPRPEAEKAKAAKPPPPSHPSRIWVQLGVGRDKSAIAFDWRKWTRQAETAFRGRKASISAWGQTNRILAGPFASEKAANEFLAQLRKAGISGAHLWTSPAGQVVDSLQGV
jgi:SPOR domain